MGRIHSWDTYKRKVTIITGKRTSWDTSKFRTYYVLNQVSIVARICRCGHYWFEDIEDGYQICEYCSTVHIMKNGETCTCKLCSEKLATK